MRRIPLSRRSHIIGFQPLATGTAEHESALERDFVILSSFLDPDAVITAQPITITFQVGAVTRRYTPDYSVAWRRATLREWRRDFAQCLREYGVEANATERAVRGSRHQSRKDGIFRAARRGDSRFIRDRADSVGPGTAPGKSKARRRRGSACGDS